MKNEEVQKIYNELISTYKNLKAEVFVTEILENSNLDFEDIDIYNKSTFSRSFRRDVINFSVDSYSNKEDKLQFNLARNGMYDSLPEGVFHEPIKSKSQLSYKEIRQKNRKEEKSARSFFSPIENEFFVQKVKIEKNERVLIDKFTNLKNNFLLDFWGLNKNMPEEYNVKLLQLLPFAQTIAGNEKLIAISLEKILGEKVTIKRTVRKQVKHTEEISDNRLGVDLVLALNETQFSYPVFDITVGPIKAKNTDKFLENGVAKQFISIFCDYFIPVEIDTKLNVTYSKEESAFVLNETNHPRVGLTTTI
ncbi:hypothetical protein [Aquimarina pacifica]|uniref:hypothetical protein n=1 Tax=Aquimarina pacifica TaxID=1296415 RepID=UPI0004707842|nr:hypothetical protein [Aquimarina pacifica]